jgi:hypothetical protein
VLPLYTPAAAAQLLAVRESWLRRRAAARAVPCTYLGKHLRFSRADLEAIVQAAAQPARTRTRPTTRRAPEPLIDAGPAHDDHDHDDPTAPGRASRTQLGVARRRGPNKASRRSGVAPAGEDAQGRAA